jgi:hypothetical protein
MVRSLVAALVVVCCVTPVVAWNNLGHKVVAEIAWRQLSAEQRQSIVNILRRHPRFDTDFAAQMTDDVLRADKAVQDHWIFQQAATWPDLIRGTREFDRPEWHYIDLPIYLDPGDKGAFTGKLPVNISADYSTAIEHYNVLQAIQHCQAALRSRAGPDVKSVAYCWLFHLVGDVHQPLHSTAIFSVRLFPKGDRGGNEIPLVHGDSLHKLWDNLLGRQSYMRNVDQEVAELSGNYHDVWESAAKETSPRKWTIESHELCESFVYDDTILAALQNTPAGTKPAPIDLPVTYNQTAGQQARRRIIAAGLRLAAILKESRP